MKRKCRWETYNVIIETLLSKGDTHYFEEIKYRLTDGEDPNIVILDIIEREVDDENGLVWLLKKNRRIC
jgi:hypothetical protein